MLEEEGQILNHERTEVVSYQWDTSHWHDMCPVVCCNDA